MGATRDPQLSVVVAIVSETIDARCDLSHLIGCLEALSQQIDPPSLEVIVPHHPSVDGIKELERRFPDVVFISVDDLRTFTGRGGTREHHDELRARGLAAARGEIIALIEDHGRPDLHWCANTIRAHQRDYAVIGGAIENGIDRPLNWAVYFCDFFRYLNPVDEGESSFVSDANATYKHSALRAVQPVWQQAFHEPEVNRALSSRGEKLALSPQIIVYQHRTNLKLGTALKERFVWGRSYGAARTRLLGTVKRVVYILLSLALPAVLLCRMLVTVTKKGRALGAFLRALPLTALLSLSWSWGELIGYLSGRSYSASARTGEAADRVRSD